MLKFIKNSFGSAGNDEPDLGGIGLDGGHICQLMQFFPIGTKLSYYPEFRKEIVLESVIIAYSINGDLIYSAAYATYQGGNLSFNDQGKKRVYSRINSFRITVPVLDPSNEVQLDYERREELQKVGGMARGNTLTLTGLKQNGQVPVVETTVNKRSILKQGLYANQTVAMLDVDTNSFVLTDQRAHVRLRTNMLLSAQFYSGDSLNLVNCTMVDFSDCSLRLAFDEEYPAEALPEEGEDLVLSFHLPGRAENISLMGNVFRIEGKAAVVMLQGGLEDGQTVPLSPIHILEIKANLLQSGQASPE
jgi:hypothetical protein